MTGILLPYQARWVADAEGIAVIEKSRRIGLSWCQAYSDVMRAASRERPGNVYYQSYAKDMTQGYISDCAEWAEKIQAAAGAVGEEAYEEGGRQVFAYKIRAATGKEIVAMTSAPRGFRSRGRPGDRGVVDEAAFVDDLGAVLKAVKAFRMWRGQIRIMSTHNGENSEFAKLCKAVRDGDQPGSIHKVTFRDALDQGLFRKICEVTGEEWSPEREEEWEAEIRADYGEDAAEELDCVPASGAGHWLSWPLIHGAESPFAGLPGQYKGGPTVIGVDVARRRDLFVFAVMEIVGAHLIVREIVERRNIKFSEQDRLLDKAVARYRPIRVAMDQTGMGEKPVEDAQRRYGQRRVEGVIMSAPRRLDVATALRERMEDGRLRIPKSAELRADLRSVRTEDGPTGAPRLVVPRTKDRGEGREEAGKTHADRFWALALGCAAAAGSSEPAGGYAGGDPREALKPKALRGRPERAMFGRPGRRAA